MASEMPRGVPVDTNIDGKLEARKHPLRLCFCSQHFYRAAMFIWGFCLVASLEITGSAKASPWLCYQG